MQNLQISVQIPDNLVLIEKVEYEQLQQERLLGTHWTMKDLETRTNKKQEWLKEHVLYQPKFKKQLDIANGGFVYYPKKSGEKWAFQATKMAQFLDDNFYLIYGGTK
ncbi:DUF771 domain-containing protein [Metasolibacillus meyeri]|uniref:DUF771 domain-containing protein n=1 Tax=Metasolibacillus meyeri TaxID=1071052 RepID=A0AAW9NT68_9BACL|nr:DUF771 domain-containing protein [Metasolibacillus meyeri]MEC1177655.1 DUF771 domain-containing protein [Metasolibacillus meyeri]